MGIAVWTNLIQFSTGGCPQVRPDGGRGVGCLVVAPRPQWNAFRAVGALGDALGVMLGIWTLQLASHAHTLLHDTHLAGIPKT